MRKSLLRTPKAGIALPGKLKPAHRPILKLQGSPNSKYLDASFSASPSPAHISNITDNLSTTSSNSAIAAADEEVESNYTSVSPLFENSDQHGLQEFQPESSVEPVGAATENLKEKSTSVEPASLVEDIVEDGGSCAEEILTESSEVTAQPEALTIVVNSSARDERERNFEVALAVFSQAMEKLCDAIVDVLLPSIEQRKRRNGNDGVFFFLARLGEMTLAFFIGAVLVFVLITAVAPDEYPTLNNLSEFTGPAPT